LSQIRGLDADGEDPPFCGGGRRKPAGCAEFVRLADDLVDREHQHGRKS
jgi:hypothetical protein